MHATQHPASSVGRSVGRSVTLYFFMIFIFGPHCSCPNGLVTSNMAPAHPHATSVAVYPALFFFDPRGRVACTRPKKKNGWNVKKSFMKNRIWSFWKEIDQITTTVRCNKSQVCRGDGKQGRIHGYRSRVQVGRGHIWGHSIIWAGVKEYNN